MARKGNPISVRESKGIAIRVFFLLFVFFVCYSLCLVLGFDLNLIWVKLKSMLPLRSFRLLFSRLLGWEVPLILLFVVWGGYTMYMGDPTVGEGGSGAGSSRRPVDLDLNLPPGSRDELSDLVAELDQVESEIHRLTESHAGSREEKEERLRRGFLTRSTSGWSKPEK